MPDPEDGTMADGVYGGKYLGLSYPLPPDWEGGRYGPRPSNQGVYVLSEMRRRTEPKASMLVTALDMFFGVRPIESAKAYAADFRKAQSEVPGMIIDREPTEVEIAGHSFMRVDYSGIGLYRAWLATDIRCHLVSFTITTTDPKAREDFVGTLEKLSLPAEAASETAGSGDGSAVPICVKDYATGENVIHQVAPAPAGPKYLKIPVRIIIGTDGRVKHVHIISAFPEQRRPIYEALLQWRLKPHRVNGRPVEVETGLVLEFKPTT